MLVQSFLDKTRTNQLEDLKDIKICNVSAFGVVILIRKGLPNELYAIKAALGWSLLINVTSKNETNNGNSQLSINRLDITTRNEKLHPAKDE